MTLHPVPEHAKSAKRKRTDCYLATVKIAVPLNMEDAESLSNTIKAVAAIKDILPDGSTVAVQATLGKA